MNQFIEEAQSAINVAELLDEDTLTALGETLLKQIASDHQSRSDWEAEHEDWFKLASQMMESKHTPWHNASNIKFPLLTLTAVHFQARAAKDLLGSPDIVRTKTIGLQKTPEDDEKGRRISYALSYELQETIPNWMEEMEQGLMVLPLVGMFFKKTYYHPALRTPVSRLVFPKHLIYHYNSQDFERCRKTELIRKYPNEVAELINAGYYIDYDFTKGGTVSAFDDESYDNEDDEAPKMFLECHCWWDLDEDGYKEPWVVTIDETAQQVVRISPRFGPKDVMYNDSNKIMHITATEYYTQYGCIPSFNSKTYFNGFGSLLGPVNAGVNTILNQLIDAGTLNNLPSGFISRGLRVRRGEEGFAPGQWKQTMSNSGDQLAKQIFPLPTKEPSPTLFQLLGLLIQAGKEIGSLSDLVLGNSPGQNQPWNTTQQVLAQGLQVYSGVFKNVHRALTKELRLLAGLNYTHLDDNLYNDILGAEPGTYSVMADFDFSRISVLPTAEPNTVTEQQRLEKSARLLQLLSGGLAINPQVVTRRVLEAEGHENIEELMNTPPPQPNFDQQIEMKRLELETAKFQRETQLEVERNKYEALKDLSAAELNFAKAKELGESSQIALAEQQLAHAKLRAEREDKRFEQLIETARVQGEQEQRTLDYDAKRRAAEAKTAATGGSDGSS